MQFEVADAGLAQTNGPEASVEIPVAIMLFETAFHVGVLETVSKERGLVLPDRLKKEWRYRIVPPVGFEKDFLPENKTEHYGPATYSQEFATLPDGAVSAVLRFDPGKRRFTPEETEALKKGIERFNTEPELAVRFRSIGESMLDAGNVRGALAEFRKLVTLHPNEAFHHGQIARALVAAGMGDAAREEARRAVELEPSFEAQWTLAYTLQHDALGRRFGAGADLNQAAASLARALEIEPDNNVVRNELATLLTFNASGSAFGSGADLAGAIEQYKKIVKKAGDPYGDNLATALLHAGRFAEVKDATKRVDLLIAAVAMSSGTDAALREAARLTSDASKRPESLLQAAARLMQARRYPEAAVLYRAGSSASPNFAASLNYADRVEKTRRVEEMTFPDAPSTPAKKLMIAMGLRRPDTELMPLFTKEAQQNWPAVLEPYRGFATFLVGRGATLSPDLMLDQDMMDLTEVVDGDDANGYDVTLFRIPRDYQFFVIREGGQYKLGNAKAPQRPELRFAQDALQRLDRNDLVGARRALDQARAETKPATDQRDVATVAAFLGAWTKGFAGTRDDIRMAASILLANGSSASSVLPVLQDFRKRAVLPSQRMNLDLALITAYMRTGKQDESLRLATETLQRDPFSVAYEFIEGWAEEIERPQAFKTFLQVRLAKNPKDEDSLRLMAQIDRQLGNFDKAEAFYRSITQDPRVTRSGDMADLARLALFHDRVTETDADALRRVPGDGKATRVLAALYAELGRTTEARQSLIQAMNMDGRAEPDNDDWYVLARIYDQLGERSAALAAYRKVAKPVKNPDRKDSAYVLAQRRIAALQ